MPLNLAMHLLPVWRWTKANPLLCLCVILALWGAYERNHHIRWRDYAKSLETASQAATEATKAMRDKERKQYQEKATHAEQEKAAALAYARSATDRYNALHRVQPSRDLRAPAAVGKADHPAEPAEVPGSAVVVSEPDMHRAAEWQAYGVACHNYLLSIGE